MAENTMLASASELAGKYLTFVLAEEEYGVEILKVQEINGIMPITRVPQTEGFVRGIINLRGNVIPVVDLRLKFGMDEKEYTQKTCIIVLHVSSKKEKEKENRTVTMGIVVDEVSEVVNIAEENIDPSPNMGDESSLYIMGIGKIEKKVIILLDIDKILSDEEAIDIEGMAKQQEV